MSEDPKYTVIAIDEVPKAPSRRNKWGEIFDDLPMLKALQFNCASPQGARRLGRTILTSILYHKPPYTVHIRTVHDVRNGSSVLYVWKKELTHD